MVDFDSDHNYDAATLLTKYQTTHFESSNNEKFVSAFPVPLPPPNYDPKAAGAYYKPE